MRLGVRVPPGVLKKSAMKTQVLKKVNQRVRILKINGMYVVQQRATVGFGFKFGEWKEINAFYHLKRAIKKKETHIVMVIMRELGHRNEFVKRRTDRKKRLGLI